MLKVQAVLYNDLHAVRDDCHTKCEQVVTLADHAAAIKELSSKLDGLTKELTAARDAAFSEGVKFARVLADYNEMIANNHIMSKKFECARQAWSVLSDPTVDQHTEARRLEAHQKLWDAIKPGLGA
jgi:capsule polysaccharide export protein KpsE/RkpR